MTEIIFSRIIARELPANIVYEDEHVIAFEDIQPVAPHHILIIPKTPIATINDIQDDDATLVGRLFLAARDIASELGIDENGYRVVMNCNKDGGQHVYHIHLHLLGGRQLAWPPG